MSVPMLPIPILIVTFRNADDVVECLESLGNSNNDPAFDVYVCENGGDVAFASLPASPHFLGPPPAPMSATT
jgi:N-acetylglucosaminyl-diphospho-decaprenol L-rhamnosyltransferase